MLIDPDDSAYDDALANEWDAFEREFEGYPEDEPFEWD